MAKKLKNIIQSHYIVLTWFGNKIVLQIYFCTNSDIIKALTHGSSTNIFDTPQHLNSLAKES